ncbi:MAG: hypothetical protein GY795_24560 [Desulfobacterales bacterium]|nr:hypothetical protein [Desulfobacterales bacterium]
MASAVTATTTRDQVEANKARTRVEEADRALARQEMERDRASRDRDAAALTARRAGWTWVDIGEMLGADEKLARKIAARAEERQR